MLLIEACAFGYALCNIFQFFLFFFNKSIDMIFPIILLVLSIPPIIAWIIFICCSRSESKSTRGKILYASIIIAISAIIITFWIVYYYVEMYEPEVILLGMGDEDSGFYFKF